MTTKKDFEIKVDEERGLKEKIEWRKRTEKEKTWTTTTRGWRGLPRPFSWFEIMPHMPPACVTLVP